jgi:hypothetical protein
MPHRLSTLAWFSKQVSSTIISPQCFHLFQRFHTQKVFVFVCSLRRLHQVPLYCERLNPGLSQSGYIADVSGESRIVLGSQLAKHHHRHFGQDQSGSTDGAERRSS